LFDVRGTGNGGEKLQEFLNTKGLRKRNMIHPESRNRGKALKKRVLSYRREEEAEMVQAVQAGIRVQRKQPEEGDWELGLKKPG
jgi:hypothetical protein